MKLPLESEQEKVDGEIPRARNWHHHGDDIDFINCYACAEPLLQIQPVINCPSYLDKYMNVRLEVDDNIINRRRIRLRAQDHHIERR
ncbi:hypothetical protein TSAR_013092 [Trichomalopsis sarcophagae]|uniref:Uncharacterized protein n=1 Tax=Trichomalopsis sarcophagae TaxID=543379 RepID=A0A232F0P1_9HYME|nr:hypothetical protein TSAR_013092 [Trichomalopsis sarcophagae]